MKDKELEKLIDDILAKIKREDIIRAIETGVENAFWRMITNSTNYPCADFYDSMEKGIEKALSKIDLNK